MQCNAIQTTTVAATKYLIGVYLQMNDLSMLFYFPRSNYFFSLVT